MSTVQAQDRCYDGGNGAARGKYPHRLASALGGNCELSVAGDTITSENGVVIVAPDNLPASMPSSASLFYANNIRSLLLNMVKDWNLLLDFEEEVTKATVITHGGAVVSEAVQKLLVPAGDSARTATS